MPRRILCPWTNFPVSFNLKMTFWQAENEIQNPQKTEHHRRHYLLIAIVVVFIIILMITMDIRKDRSRHKFSVVSNHEEWIHDSNSKFHYGIVLDCGSSGSRVFIYYWPDHNGNPEHLLNIKQMIDRDGKPVRMKVRPGLSTYEDKPENSSSYIAPLLRHAANHIPKSKHSETPLYILATAGMRLLSKQKQDAIINNLVTEIPKKFLFLFSSSQVEVITGKQEGIYAWITINYVLGRFDHSEASHHSENTSDLKERKKTVGSLDMGGASTQITFEVPETVKLPAGLKTEVNLGCDSHMTVHKYILYVSTFLGFGATTARSRYLDMIFTKKNHSLPSHSRIHLDPCLPSDIRIKGSHKGVNYRMKGLGNFDVCRNQLTPLLNNSEPCENPPCSLNGVYQPQISFNSTDFYGFSEFWYSVNDVLRLPGVYDARKFDAASKEFCKTKWPVLHKRFQSRLYPFADEHRFMYQCFKSAWMTTVLHDGFGFPRYYRRLHPTFMIDGKEIQWTLGAILYRTRFLPLREMQASTKGILNPRLSFIVLGDSAFKVVLFLCSLVVLFSIYVIFAKPRLAMPSFKRFLSNNSSSNMVSETPNYPTDVRISL
ncbi:ectonucleoside triphosphate diphosphohydrolase 4-like [Xenia sp. Carnegie-2017]|uniref:ectonucleoside triphosphate diphosphohydrolase 4-like n=1 Tax=Xenia sp. Carnegie-2017 TaxID=2897299 RepID=UPI001F04912E|nr:ectonucleoside triphosphate diphosphohydrolase 4-like [Xenia sp. Carnegie-2017]